MTMSSKFKVAEFSSIFANEHHAYAARGRGKKRKTGVRGRVSPAMDVGLMCSVERREKLVYVAESVLPWTSV